MSDAVAPPEKTKHCFACGNDIAESAKQCPICNSPQNLDLCSTCGKALPYGIPRCNGCGNYRKGLQSIFPFSNTVLALLVALIAVISPAITALFYYLDYDSHTKVKVVGASKDYISVVAWNTGHKPATLVDYSLVFTEEPEKEIMLEPVEDDRNAGRNVIASATPVLLRLTNSVNIPDTRKSTQYTQEERTSRLDRPWSNIGMRLSVKVEESSDEPPALTPRSDVFPASRIREFIEGHVKP